MKEDEAGRKGELARLLPLVRFPMMADAPMLVNAERLVAKHPLALELLQETHQVFAAAPVLTRATHSEAPCVLARALYI